LALGRIDLEDQGGAVSIRIAEEERHQEGVNQASLLRCLFGNPFLPETILDSTLLGWKGGLVQRIAQGIYDNWAFDRLPYLAETLVEAGCGDETLFGHCRTAGLHGRGCWVVDLLLGKN
jgi:hypothetical protein